MITTLQSVFTQVADRSQFGSNDPTTATEDPNRPPERASDSDQLRVLSLSAHPTASFYERQVSALEECGVECTTISPPPYELGDDRSPWQYLKVWIETLREVSDDYDVIHANYGLVGPIALAQPKRPVVMTLWGSDVMSGGRVASVSKAAARFCDAVIAPSRRLAESLPCESHVIQFDVKMDLFRPIPRTAARERLGWDNDKKIVLFPYGRREVKNYPMAQRIVDNLSGDVQLRRVFDAAYEEMALYYNASDALIVTSDREAGPMTVKEAAACNVPVVSTDVGFASELLNDVRNSYVASSESTFVDRLDAVLQSDGRSNGRPEVKRYNGMGEQLCSLYESTA